MARTRSTRAHDQVLKAATTLFAERGIDNTSMDAVAELSGVSKATIYKHWSDKDALCMEAMVRLYGLDKDRPTFDSGDLRQDLLTCLTYKAAPEFTEWQARIQPHLWAYSARNQEFGNAWRERIMRPPHQQLAQLLDHGIRAGQLSSGLLPEVGVAMLIGPVIYRSIFAMLHGGLPEDLPERLVDALLKAYAPASSVQSPQRIHPAAKSTKKPPEPRPAYADTYPEESQGETELPR